MKSLRKATAVLLVLAMILSFALCGCGANEESAIKKDAAGYLYDAYKASSDELTAGIKSGLIGDFLELGKADERTTEFSLLIDDEAAGTDEDATLYGTAYSDRVNGTFYMPLAVSLEGENYEAGILFSKEFIGLACEPLLGNSDLYGFAPTGIADQCAGSVIEQYELLNAETAGKLEDAIAGFTDMFANGDNEAFNTSADAIVQNYISKAEITYEPEKVNVSGADTDGFAFTVSFPSDATAEAMQELHDLMNSAPGVQKLLELGILPGTVFADIESRIAEVTAEDITVSMTAETAGFKLINADLDYVSSTADSCITMHFYKGEENAFCTIAKDNKAGTTSDIDIVVTETADSNTCTIISNDTGLAEGSVEGEFTVTKNADGTFAISAGSEGDGISVEGTITAGAGSVKVENANIVATAEGQTENIGTLTVSISNTLEMPELPAQKNIFEMTEDELMSIVVGALMVSSEF